MAIIDTARHRLRALLHPGVDATLQELRFALRGFRRTPLSMLAALLSIALASAPTRLSR